MPPHDPPPAPAPAGRSSSAAGTPASQCTGYGDQAVDQNSQSVDVWRAGLRLACGYSYESGDNPMPAGTPFPPPRPFRLIEHTEPVFGFKVFYLGADTPTPCDDLRIIFHQGNGIGGHQVRYHSMQYAIAHCDANGTYLGYTDVAAYADTGGLEDIDPNRLGGDDGQRPMKLIPTLADIQQYNVFEVWYVNFFIYNPNLSPSGQPTNTGFPIVTVRPGFDIHNVAIYQSTLADFTVRYTCDILGPVGTRPGDPSCQYDAAKRGLSHPDVDIYPAAHVLGYIGGLAPTEFYTDLHGGFDGPLVIKQHVYQGSLYRPTCQADGGVGTLPNCYPEFVRGPNSPGANQAKTSPYQSPGPATYFVPGLRYPN
jgi:hypothetical protein